MKLGPCHSMSPREGVRLFVYLETTRRPVRPAGRGGPWEGRWDNGQPGSGTDPEGKEGDGLVRLFHWLLVSQWR